MISLGAGEFSETERHHFEKAALDLACEIRVPLYPSHQHYAVAFERVAVYEALNAVRSFADGNYVQLAYYRTTHGAFMHAEVREYVGLALRGCRAMAAHSREDEGPKALRFPIIYDHTDDDGQVGDAAATHTNCYAAAGPYTCRKLRRRQLTPYLGSHVTNCEVWEVLPHRQHVWKVHFGCLLLVAAVRSRTGCDLSPTFLLLLPNKHPQPLGGDRERQFSIFRPGNLAGEEILPGFIACTLLKRQDCRVALLLRDIYSSQHLMCVSLVRISDDVPAIGGWLILLSSINQGIFIFLPDTHQLLDVCGPL